MAVAGPRVAPRAAPTRITANGCMVIGTGVNGRGMAICAASAMKRVAPATSNTFAAARPRTRFWAMAWGAGMGAVLVVTLFFVRESPHTASRPRDLTDRYRRTKHSQ